MYYKTLWHCLQHMHWCSLVSLTAGHILLQMSTWIMTNGQNWEFRDGSVLKPKLRKVFLKAVKIKFFCSIVYVYIQVLWTLSNTENSKNQNCVYSTMPIFLMGVILWRALENPSCMPNLKSPSSSSGVNISEFIFKLGYTKMGNANSLDKLTSPLDLQTQCFLFNVQLLWSCDWKNERCYEKHILLWKLGILNKVQIFELWF